MGELWLVKNVWLRKPSCWSFWVLQAFPKVSCRKCLPAKHLPTTRLKLQPKAGFKYPRPLSLRLQTRHRLGLAPSKATCIGNLFRQSVQSSDTGVAQQEPECKASQDRASTRKQPQFALELGLLDLIIPYSVPNSSYNKGRFRPNSSSW